MRTALALGLLLLSAGCRRESTSPTGAADAGAQDASAPPSASALVLGDEFGFRGALWASSGDAVAITRSGFVRVPPKKDAVARILRAPEGERLEHAAAARRADVLAALTPEGALLVWRDGGPPKTVMRLPGLMSVTLSDDGTLAAVTNSGHASDTEVQLVDLARGDVRHTIVTPRKSWEGDRVAFDASGRWLAVSGPIPQPEWVQPGELGVASVVVPTEGGTPETIKNVAVRGWLGGTLVLHSRRELVLFDPATKTPRRMPICTGDVVLVDEVKPRVAVLCSDRVEIVRTPDGARTAIPLPPGLGAESQASVAPTREGEDLLLRIAEGRVFRLDVAARKAREVEEAEHPPIRSARGVPLAPAALGIASCETCRFSPDGALWIDEARSAHRTWPLVMLAPEERSVPDSALTWGTKDLRTWWPRDLRANAGGLDWEYAVDHGTETRARVRLGPDALMTPDAPAVPESREVRDHPCPTEAHVGLPKGELWYERNGRRCLCADYTCTAEFGPERHEILDARPDVVAFAWHESNATLVELWTAEGTKRAEARIEDECEGGRLSADGKALVMVCRARPLPASPDAGAPEDDRRRWELVELDAATGMGKRTTRLPWSAMAPRLLAVGPGVMLLASGAYEHTGPAMLVEAGSGRLRAQVQGFEDPRTMAHAVVARFPDGKVEIVGDEALAERALRCERAGELRPFAACKDEVRVRGRFRLIRAW